MSKEISLTIEQFQDGEENEFLIKSPREIQLTLRAIAKKKSASMLYFNHGNSFFKSMLLAANDSGLWIDAKSSETDNIMTLQSKDYVVVTLHQGAKVQFECQNATQVNYEGRPAFYFPLPEKMVRLQRRNFFRLPVSEETHLECIMPPSQIDPEPSVSLTIVDISLGGIAFVCKGINIQLEAGIIYPDCSIDLPGTGTLTATIMVKNLFDITSPSGVVTQHAGCEFLKLDAQMSMLLQRYIGVMQTRHSETN